MSGLTELTTQQKNRLWQRRLVLPFRHSPDEKFEGLCPTHYAGYDVKPYRDTQRLVEDGACTVDMARLALPEMLRRAAGKPGVNIFNHQKDETLLKLENVGARYVPGSKAGTLWLVEPPFADELIKNEMRPGLPPPNVFGLKDSAAYEMPDIDVGVAVNSMMQRSRWMH